ncbi:MAG: HIT domain-containing protein [Candidatus Micrarchaeota archaeon]|nr:HIT domain-containing protein [Candidatus Micrarchaeota archaeon]
MFRSFLFPNSRMKYVKKNRNKVEKKGCVFCRIANEDPDIEKKVLYKDDKVMVMMNIYPYNVGHLQVVPVRHVVWLDELTKDERDALFEMVNRTVKFLKKVEKPVAMNIGMNIGGETAGASIMHLHVHVVPRYKSDFGFMEITASTRVLVEPIEETYQRFLKHADMLKG